MQTFDTRDNAEFAGKYSRSLDNVPWYWSERSLSGFREPHEKAMARLVRSCKKDGQEVYAAFFHNYAVSVILKPSD